MDKAFLRSLARRISVARGLEPADLVLAGGRLVDVVSGEIYPADIAVCDGIVAGVGETWQGREIVDLGGSYVCPALIDAHVHIESSLIPPREFARAVVPRGVTTVISNPHEIANVLGADGVRFMLADAAAAPLDTLVTLPSCVPATALATSGAELTPAEIAALAADPRVVGLGEVMDFPGVLAGAPRVMEELARFRGMPVDGHCPGLSGHELNAYAAAGPTTEHECTTLAEAREKLARGLRILLREGSAARNLRALLPLVTPRTERHLAFCTDDRTPRDLLIEGSVDHLVRTAIAAGVDPVIAVRLATLNPAEHFRLFDRGAIVPGRRADLVVVRDLADFRPERVYHRGVLVARDGCMVSALAAEEGSAAVRDTVHIDWSGVDLRVATRGDRMRVIGIRPDQLVTDALLLAPRVEGGLAVADPERDVMKMAVIERHHRTGRVGLGFVQGVGLCRGALAGTVAHDHHNLLVVGADDRSMLTAARAAAAGGGGLAAARGEEVLAVLPLPIAGLMSDLPVEEVAELTETLLSAARALGSPLHDPFMTLSFLALEVIPELKLTDLGLVEVAAGRVVPLFEG